MSFQQTSFDALWQNAATGAGADTFAVTPATPGGAGDWLARIDRQLLLEAAAFFIRQRSDSRQIFLEELPVNQPAVWVQFQKSEISAQFAGYLDCRFLVTAAAREPLEASQQGAALAGRCHAETAATPYYQLHHVRTEDWQLVNAEAQSLPRAVFALVFAVNLAAVN